MSKDNKKGDGKPTTKPPKKFLPKVNKVKQMKEEVKEYTQKIIKKNS